MAQERDRSMAEVLQDIVGNIQEIVRSEVRLAKAEVRDEAAKAKIAGILVGGGAAGAFFAAFFLLLMIVYALTRVVPDWAAALIVSVLMAIIAGSMLSMGLKRFREVHPTPERTVESVKENVEWLKHQTK